MSQGWTNDATWCVALTLDNTPEHLRLAQEITRDCASPSLHEAAEATLMIYCRRIKHEITAMASWVWEDATLADVDWAQLRKHYEETRV